MDESPIFWVLARASGFAAYGLLTLSVLAGLLLATRPLVRLVGPASVTVIHRTLSLSALAMLVVHMATLAFDATVHFDIADLIVPGHAHYRPVWTALGIVAAELMVVIHMSFSVRRLIGIRAWRLLHRAAFVVFAFATIHGLMAGSDSATNWAQTVYIASATAVAGAFVWRVRESKLAARTPRPLTAQQHT